MNLLLIGGVILRPVFQLSLQRAVRRKAGSRAQIGQAAMMPRNGERSKQIPVPARRDRAGRSMIHLGHMLRIGHPALHIRRVLADVMQKPGPIRMPARAEFLCEAARARRHPMQMIPERLNLSIFPFVSNIHFLPSLLHHCILLDS